MSKSKAEKEALGYTLLELCFKSELNSHDVRSIIRCIAEEADTNVRDKWGHTSLMYASRDGHSDVVHELLVRGGADPNMANRCFRNNSRDRLSMTCSFMLICNKIAEMMCFQLYVYIYFYLLFILAIVRIWCMPFHIHELYSNRTIFVVTADQFLTAACSGTMAGPP